MIDSSLFQRLGGAPAIDAAVDIFYQKVLRDDRVSRFFQGVDMKQQRGKQKAFLALAFGAPVKYTGKDLRQAHAQLIGQGLGDVHFDAVAEHLAQTLVELRISPDLIGDVLALVGTTRNDVLNR